MKKSWGIAARMKIGGKSLASKKMTQATNEISFCVFGIWLLLARRGIILGDVC
jgi:hypothetical protein